MNGGYRYEDDSIQPFSEVMTLKRIQIVDLS
jgi:hypothetical protein